MRQNIVIKCFLGLNTFLFPEIIVTEITKLDFLKKNAFPQMGEEKDEILRNDKTL